LFDGGRADPMNRERLDVRVRPPSNGRSSAPKCGAALGGAAKPAAGAAGWTSTMWIKRSRGGSDFDLDHLVALCRACHAQTDAPWVEGRLVIRPVGGRKAVQARWRKAKKSE
jgi:hypothetical protein